MTLQELIELKDRRATGVLIHREKWTEILEWAIELTKHHEGHDKKSSEEWIDWIDGECPVAEDQQVEFLCKDGYGAKCKAGLLMWERQASGDDIIKYRIVK